jgi:formylmethanofuran dehydrogenase subunit C
MKTSFLLFLALSPLAASAQGPLNPPPGVPAPNMKSLDQIEARKPIPATMAAPDEGPHFTIDKPGSYYLTGNVTVSTGDAIVVSSDDVSIDLNGFTIRSTLDGLDIGAGIRVSGQHSNLAVKNGFIVSASIAGPPDVAEESGFRIGIGPLFLFGSADRITQLTVTDVQVRGIASIGILGQSQSTLTRCSASNCIDVGLVGDTLRDCSAVQVRGIGIDAGNAMNCRGSSLTGTGLTCRENATNCTGQSVDGIGLRSSGNASECTGTSTNNTGLHCDENATNCNGRSTVSGGSGLECLGNATNCTGRCSGFGFGIHCVGNATNCTGISLAALNGTGLFVEGNATNCTGTSLSQSGIICLGTATACRGKRDGGVGLEAAIAIGCTRDGTGIIIASKFLGTP